MTRSELASGGLVGESTPIPAWAINVLATPGDKRRLHAVHAGIAANNGELIGLHDRIVDLSGHSQEVLQRHSREFVSQDAGAVEFLKPSQQHFRRLLRRFARGLAPEATVADIASADAEFANYFPTQRFLAMDLSTARLQRAIGLGRVDFAVLADIRRPPLLDGSLDAIVSSNTLHHLPAEDLPDIVEGLVRCLKPGGKLATTLWLAAEPAVIDRIGKRRIVEHVRIGGPVSRWWERAVFSRSNQLIRRLGSRTARATKPFLDLVSSTVALGDRLVQSSSSAELDYDWLVIRASH